MLLERAWDITQFYRGELFTVVDCVLTLTTMRPEQQQESLIFFNCVLTLIAEWLKRFPTLVGHYRRGLEDPNLFTVDREVALASCWPELFMTLGRLFKLDMRCDKFFTKQRNEPIPQGFNARST